LVDHLDVAMVVKAFQAVSTEIAFERFINRLLVTAVEHAGAARGRLLLARRRGFSIEAEAVAHASSVDVRLRGEVATESDLPESVLEQVSRTRETVLVDDAMADDSLSGNGYIVQKRARSILCL